MRGGETTLLNNCLWRLQAGDADARNRLLAAADERLRRLTRKMLKSYPVVGRWDQTDDVYQNACLRLHRALQEVVPDSVRHFFNLAAVQIRRELIDLSRHYAGPEGIGANHATEQRNHGAKSGNNGRENDPSASATFDPARLERWREFHRQVDLLPDEEREIFNLLWYQGMSQVEAGEMLDISERTLQRRWQSARLKLFEALQGELPE